MVRESHIDQDVLAEAIKTCDRDPIHIPGSIQSFGYLVATDLGVTQLDAVSANLAEALGTGTDPLFDLSPGDLLTAEQLHGVRNVLGHDTSSRQREYVGMKTLGDTEYQVSVHRKGEHAILEFTPEQAPVDERFIPMEEARRFLTRDPDIDHPHDILRGAVERLRALVGFARVKSYLFLPNDDGEVIAESRRADMPSFLGLRFPASDIPKQARELYSTTPLRLISDVRGSDVPLLVRRGRPTDLDLSLAVLRGTDSVHIQYLRNMGVGGTMSIPVVVRGKLYALFACHHPEPRVPDASALMAAELAGKLIGLQVEHALELRRQGEF
ncbi:MAG: GAF domain-containing protein, partial [Pseudomonadota bacterium]